MFSVHCSLDYGHTNTNKRIKIVQLFSHYKMRRMPAVKTRSNFNLKLIILTDSSFFLSLSLSLSLISLLLLPLTFSFFFIQSMVSWMEMYAKSIAFPYRNWCKCLPIANHFDWNFESSRINSKVSSFVFCAYWFHRHSNFHQSIVCRVFFFVETTSRQTQFPYLYFFKQLIFRNVTEEHGAGRSISTRSGSKDSPIIW